MLLQHKFRFSVLHFEVPVLTFVADNSVCLVTIELLGIAADISSKSVASVFSEVADLWNSCASLIRVCSLQKLRDAKTNAMFIPYSISRLLTDN